MTIHSLSFFENASSDTTIDSYRILGDATGEMGPFYFGYINNWYDDYSGFVGSTYPWFIRVGYYYAGSSAGQFNLSRRSSGTDGYYSFRPVLAFEN